MFPQKRSTAATVDSKTYPLGEKTELSGNGHQVALLALSHTPLEHRLYSAMTPNNNSGSTAFTARRLMELTGVRSLSTIRRALEGLLTKLSIERAEKSNGNSRGSATYRALAPEEIISRRHEQGSSDGKVLDVAGHRSFERAIARVVDNKHLSRREAQVALCCVEGLTNAEIGQRLKVTEQTVKFHLRHVFIKFGVKRRAELISRLLM